LCESSVLTLFLQETARFQQTDKAYHLQ
jgi:hypothetical protein